MEEPIIEIMGKRVKVVQDGPSPTCYMCAFSEYCEFLPLDDVNPPLCEKVNKKYNQHFEEVKDENFN